MKRIVKIFSIVLSLILILGTISPVTAKAASKPSVSPTSTNISIGKQTKGNIIINNKISSAKYTYSSSNEKIVKVSSKGVLTGVNYGTAKITVKQTYKKKTTTIGVTKVTVKKASIIEDSDGWLVIGKEIFADSPLSLTDWDIVTYAIPNATYTYYSDDKSLLTINKNGKIVETKKAGLVTVTVKETYNKKTRTVGKFKIKIMAPTISVKNNVMNIGIGDKFSIYDCYKYYSEQIYVVIKGQNVDDNNNALEYVLDEDGMWDGDFKGVNEGSMTVFIYKGNEKKDSNLLGTFTVNVKSIPATDLILYTDSMTYDLSELPFSSIYTRLTPEDSTDKLVATSSDPSIVSVTGVSPDEDGYTMIWIKALKTGTVTLTMKAGSITKEMKVTVIDSDSE